MTTDPILEEIYRFREAYAARFNYDLEAIWRDLHESQERRGADVVTFPPKPPIDVSLMPRQAATNA